MSFIPPAIPANIHSMASGNLEMDLTQPEGALLALGASQNAQKFRINLDTIILSGLVFITLIAWYDFLQTAFIGSFGSGGGFDRSTAPGKFWYAIFVTFFNFIIIGLIYYHTKDYTH